MYITLRSIPSNSSVTCIRHASPSCFLLFTLFSLAFLEAETRRGCLFNHSLESLQDSSRSLAPSPSASLPPSKMWHSDTTMCKISCRFFFAFHLFLQSNLLFPLERWVRRSPSPLILPPAPSKFDWRIMHKLINFPPVMNPLPPELDFFFLLFLLFFPPYFFFFFLFKPSWFQSEPESFLELRIPSDGLGGKDYLCVHWFGMIPSCTSTFPQNSLKCSFKASWKFHLKVRTDNLKKKRRKISNSRRIQWRSIFFYLIG